MPILHLPCWNGNSQENIQLNLFHNMTPHIVNQFYWISFSLHCSVLFSLHILPNGNSKNPAQWDRIDPRPHRRWAIWDHIFHLVGRHRPEQPCGLRCLDGNSIGFFGQLFVGAKPTWPHIWVPQRPWRGTCGTQTWSCPYLGNILGHKFNPIELPPCNKALFFHWDDPRGNHLREDLGLQPGLTLARSTFYSITQTWHDVCHSALALVLAFIRALWARYDTNKNTKKYENK